jgi:hypothetical protein
MSQLKNRYRDSAETKAIPTENMRVDPNVTRW